MDISIGDRLRHVRTKFDLSQRELARRTGIANSTISLIESNSTNPSIGALKRILDGIPINMAEFFAMEIVPEPAHSPALQRAFYQSEELLEIGKDEISFRRVGNNTPGRTLQMLKERYEPGADTGRIMLTHEGEEVGIVVSGCIEVTVGEQRRFLRTGDAYYFDSRQPHRFRCLGPQPCEIISASTPPTF